MSEQVLDCGSKTASIDATCESIGKPAVSLHKVSLLHHHVLSPCTQLQCLYMFAAENKYCYTYWNHVFVRITFGNQWSKIYCSYTHRHTEMSFIYTNQVNKFTWIWEISGEFPKQPAWMQTTFIYWQHLNQCLINHLFCILSEYLATVHVLHR